MNGNDITMFTDEGTEALVLDEAFYVILKSKQADKAFIQLCEKLQENYEYFDSSTEENPNYLYYDECRDMWVNFKIELKAIDYIKGIFGME